MCSNCYRSSRSSITLIDNVDQLKELANAASLEARIAVKQSQRGKLQSMHVLHARTAGALPCAPTTAGVATFLSCEESSLEEAVPMHDNVRKKHCFYLQFKSAEAAAAAYAGSAAVVTQHGLCSR